MDFGLLLALSNLYLVDKLLVNMVPSGKRLNAKLSGYNPSQYNYAVFILLR